MASIKTTFALRSTGFTLIETMVAITILTFAMAGPMFIADRSIVAAQTARDQLIATYLAQEGIEQIRAMRDDAYLTAYHDGGSAISQTAWDNFLSGGGLLSISKCIAPDVCTLDPGKNKTLKQCNASAHSCDALSITGCTNSSAGLSCTPPNSYTQQDSSGTVTSPFTRTVQGVIVAPHEVKIVSTVSWTFHNTPYTVTVSDHLTAWH